jgi:hypothetical protein
MFDQCFLCDPKRLEIYQFSQCLIANLPAAASNGACRNVLVLLGL